MFEPRKSQKPKLNLFGKNVGITQYNWDIRHKKKIKEISILH